MQRTNYLATAALIAICFSYGHANSQEHGVQYGVQHVDKGKVEVRIAGPFQVAEHDKRLQEFLRTSYTFQWDHQTTASDIAKDLSICVPFFVDHRALEEIGLVADAVVHSAFQSQATKKKKTNKAPPKPTKTNIDPFAIIKPDPNTKGSVKSRATPPADTQGQLVRWWDKPSEASFPTTLSAKKDIANAAMLFHFLDASDLTIHNRAGQWLITTRERAEETQATRLYDVTRITPIGDVRPANEQPVATFGFCGSVSPRSLDRNSLTQSIQTSIAPDVWECLGGPSTLDYIKVDGRIWMVVNTTVTVHWRVEAFLNQLAR